MKQKLCVFIDYTSLLFTLLFKKQIPIDQIDQPNDEGVLTILVNQEAVNIVVAFNPTTEDGAVTPARVKACEETGIVPSIVSNHIL